MARTIVVDPIQEPAIRFRARLMPRLMRLLPASMEMNANGVIAGYSRDDTLKITGDPGRRNVECIA